MISNIVNMSSDPKLIFFCGCSLYQLDDNTFYLDSSPTETTVFEPGLNQDGSRIALSDDKTVPGMILDLTGQGLRKLGDGVRSWDLPSINPVSQPKPARPPGSYCPSARIALCCKGFNERSDPLKLRRRQTQEERKYPRDWAACISRKFFSPP